MLVVSGILIRELCCAWICVVIDPNTCVHQFNLVLSWSEVVSLLQLTNPVEVDLIKQVHSSGNFDGLSFALVLLRPQHVARFRPVLSHTLLNVKLLQFLFLHPHRIFSFLLASLFPKRLHVDIVLWFEWVLDKLAYESMFQDGLRLYSKAAYVLILPRQHVRATLRCELSDFKCTPFGAQLMLDGFVSFLIRTEGFKA